MQLALYQPDIPQNLGTLLRLAACMQVDLSLIEPCGFPFDDRKVRRAGMDYIDQVTLHRHHSWERFVEYRVQTGARLVLLTTKSPLAYTDFAFAASDILLVGRETAGVPEEVAALCDALVTVPMHPPMRSLNVAVAASMVLGEALRQVKGFYSQAT
jgi:tRNA (cytidine/uridine-2'-O-)-methyltransferase